MDALRADFFAVAGLGAAGTATAGVGGMTGAGAGFMTGRFAVAAGWTATVGAATGLECADADAGLWDGAAFLAATFFEAGTTEAAARAGLL
ncbi:MAG: hypothetical protein KGK18_05130, partial [Burkholderiales bacterium]|nr:hypothetical protein [Burkholderiales bacterium]